MITNNKFEIPWHNFFSVVIYNVRYKKINQRFNPFSKDQIVLSLCFYFTFFRQFQKDDLQV